ncbi:hypothetical protein ACHAWF_013227 [Thalassiosira exigua]
MGIFSSARRLLLPQTAIMLLLPRAFAFRASRAGAGGRGKHCRSAWVASPAFVGPVLGQTAWCPSDERSRRFRQPPTRGIVALCGTSSPGGEGAQLSGLTVNELKERLREEGLPTSGLKAELIRRLSSTSGSEDGDARPSKAKSAPARPSKRKFKINPNWRQEFNADALRKEFDDMAKKEGFDATTAYYADGATFDDDFTEDDFDFDEDEGDDFDDDVPDLGPSDAQQSMEERLAMAKRDQTRGRVSVPEGLDKFSRDVTFDELKNLGFRREANPFGSDETPRREQFKVIAGSMTCSGCGAGFQEEDEVRPGFLPPEKYAIQTKLAKIEEAQKLQEKAESAEWSPEDEVDWLLRQKDPDGDDGGEEDLSNLGVDEMAERMGLDLEVLSRKKVICKRCHGLQNFGTVEQNLRHPVSQEEFRKLLLPLRNKKAVIVALVDLFDFSGSVLPELDEIAGDNPVILAANKADLLPAEMGQTRGANWVRRELEYMNVQSIANIGGAVRLVSCKTGFGITALMDKVKSLAEEMECDIYVVGAANAGKSTLVNYLLDGADPSKSPRHGGKRRAGNANKRKGSVTTSPLPGTTLKFIKIELGGGKCLYDTPGLLVPGCLTDRLTPEELKIVLPKKCVEMI